MLSFYMLALFIIIIIFWFCFNNKMEKLEKYKNNVCILVLVYFGWPLKQSFSTLYHL